MGVPTLNKIYNHDSYSEKNEKRQLQLSSNISNFNKLGEWVDGENHETKCPLQIIPSVVPNISAIKETLLCGLNLGWTVKFAKKFMSSVPDTKGMFDVFDNKMKKVKKHKSSRML